MRKKAEFIICISVIGIGLLYLYTLLHEGGHALVAILNGGRVDWMVLGLNAQVQTSGTDFTPFTEALFNSMGVLLPVIVLIPALLVYNPKIKNSCYHIFFAAFSISITSSLLAWVVLPIVSFFTLIPASDDTTKFLNVTGLHPLIVTLSATLLIFALVFFIFKRGIFEKMKVLNPESIQMNGLMWWFSIVALIVIVVFSVVQHKPILEASFSLIVDSTTENSTLPFVISKNQMYSMDLELEAEGILTDVQIYTVDGALIHQNICEWFTLETQLTLDKGNYVLVLTYLKDSISMREHFISKGYTFTDDELKMLDEVYLHNDVSGNVPISFSVSIKSSL